MIWGDPWRYAAMALAKSDCAGFDEQSDSRVTYY
jgi:hypothetical protein